LLSRYHQTIQQTKHHLDTYGFGEAAKVLYEFFWGDFCDWYIELVKSRLAPEAPVASKLAAQQTLAYTLDGTLKLLHPFVPHITAELWTGLTQTDRDISLQAYPVADIDRIDTQLEQQFALFFGTIRTIRNLRAEADIKPSLKAAIVLQSDSNEERQSLAMGRNYICDAGKVDDLQIVDRAIDDRKSIANVYATVQVILPLSGVVEMDAFVDKLHKKLAKIDKEITSLTGKLQNPNFVDRALPEVVQAARDNLTEVQKQAEILREKISNLTG
jgi:valyl-tRNA synthetase